ncbi:MAG: polymorphic toxin-type HINT domain-containing protein [Candidatus Omnitrophota bacterium]|nr:polymorphic toxin-type HINT domain-containing protein [Candidatus Omnitrophota bacterium]
MFKKILFVTILLGLVFMPYVWAVMPESLSARLKEEVSQNIPNSRLANTPYSNKIQQNELKQSANWQAFTRHYGDNWQVVFNTATATAHRVFNGAIELNLSPESQPQEVEAAVKEFISSEPILGVGNVENLLLARIQSSEQTGWSVVFQQAYRGLQVIGGLVNVGINQNGKLVFVGSDYHSLIDCAIEPTLSSQEANNITDEQILRQLNLEGPIVRDVEDQTRLVIYPKFEQGAYSYRLAYRVKTTLPRPVHDFVHFVDAHTGEVLRFYDAVMRANIDGTASSSIYPATPFDTPVVRSAPNNSIKLDGSTTRNTDANGYYQFTGLVPGSLHSLRSLVEGQYLKVYLFDDRIPGDIIENGRHSANLNAGQTHNFTWGLHDDPYYQTVASERNVFTHANVFHNHITQLLGTIPNTVRLGTTVEIAEYPWIWNAYYSPGSDTLGFGTGVPFFQNFGQYASIVAHEYMHYVSNRVFGLGLLGKSQLMPEWELDPPEYLEVYVLHEALSDYFAADFLNDPRMAAHLEKSGQAWLRNVDNNFLYYSDLISETYSMSTIISGALWDLRELLGTQMAADLVKTAFATYHPRTIADFLTSILLADDDEQPPNILNGTPHFQEIYKAFAIEHEFSGLFIDRYHSVNFNDDNIGLSLGNGNGIVEPGERIELTIPIYNGLFVVNLPYDIQVNSATLTSDSPYITAIVAQGSYGTIPQNEFRNVTYVMDISAQGFLAEELNLNLALDFSVGNTGERFNSNKEVKLALGFKRTIVDAIGEARNKNFDLSGNNIAYASNTAVKVYNLVTREERLIKSYRNEAGSVAARASIDGRTVVWMAQEDEIEKWKVKLYDLGDDLIFGTADDGNGGNVVSVSTWIEGNDYEAIYPKVAGRYILFYKAWESDPSGDSYSYIAYYDMGPDKKYFTQDDGGPHYVTDFPGPYPNTYMWWDSAGISEKGFAWIDRRQADSEVYFFCSADRRVYRITNDTYEQGWARVSDQWIVWQDSRDGNLSIYGYNFGPDGLMYTADDLGEMRLSPGLSTEMQPEISSSHLLYYNSEERMVKVMNLTTGKVIDLDYQPFWPNNHPAVEGSRIAFSGDEFNANGFLYEITTSETIHQEYFNSPLNRDIWTLFDYPSVTSGMLKLTSINASDRKDGILLRRNLDKNEAMTFKADSKFNNLNSHFHAFLEGNRRGESVYRRFGIVAKDNQIYLQRYIGETEFLTPIRNVGTNDVNVWWKVEFEWLPNQSVKLFVYRSDEPRPTTPNATSIDVAWNPRISFATRSDAICFVDNLQILGSPRAILSNQAPRFPESNQQVLNRPAQVGLALSLPVIWQDPDSNPENITMTHANHNNAVPAPILQHNGQEWYWNWIPTALGQYQFSIYIYDDINVGLMDTIRFTIDVRGPGNCLLKGTKISLADGTNKPIEKIAVGDLVLAIKHGKPISRKVLKTFKHPKVAEFYRIKTEDGRILRVTGEHRVFSNGDYRAVKELKLGDSLSILEGDILKKSQIQMMEKIKKQVDVYNFEVEEVQNYFAQGVLVHNSKATPREIEREEL